MPFAALILGAILIVVAFNNSAGSLASELESDVPGFFKWAAAIVAILALGYIPGFKTPSRWLLGLVLLVIFLSNWQTFYSNITSLAQSGGSSASGTGQGATNPSASYVATYAPQAQSTSASSASGTATASAAPISAAQNLALNPLNPSAYTALAQGFGASG